MSDVNETDWNLINAYCDGELSEDETTAIETRLKSEPLLQQMAEEVRMVSSALSKMRPAPVSTLPDHLPAPANRNWRPTAPMAMCASIAVAAMLIAGLLLWPKAPQSPMQIHQAFTSMDYGLTEPQNVLQSSGSLAPSLELVNLFLVDLKDLPKDRMAAHYSGLNNCRLTVIFGPQVTPVDPPVNTYVNHWSSGEFEFTAIASGMDQRRFNAIANYLRQATQSAGQPNSVLAVRQATEAAAPCQRA